MSSSPDQHEQRIIGSWHANADAWSSAIRSGSIGSRVLATDRAIVEALLQASPGRVLDVGCGEGWLAQTLLDRNIAVVGVDAIPALVARAAERAVHSGARSTAEFHVLDYAAIARRELRCAPCDAAVCNFSLLGNDSVEEMLAALPWFLRRGGRLIIQTLHPRAACGDAPYEDGWREGSWQGFGPEFKDPAPWYFRTLESWLRLLHRCGFSLKEMREPRLADSNIPASVIFIGEVIEVTR